MTCKPTCRKPNGNQAHCGADGCHETFSTVANFDRHRVGDPEHRRCADPAERGMRINAFGVWSHGGTRPRYWDADSASAVMTQGGETVPVVPPPRADDSEPAETRSGGWGDYPLSETYPGSGIYE